MSEQSPEEIGRFIVDAAVRVATRMHAETGTTEMHVCELTPAQYEAVTMFDRKPRAFTMGPLPVVMLPTRTIAIEGVELTPISSPNARAALAAAIREMKDGKP